MANKFFAIVNGVKSLVSISTGDLSLTTDKKFVTDAHLTILGNTSGTNTGDNVINNALQAAVPWSVSYDSPEVYISSMCVYNGKLYAGSGSLGIVYVFDGTTWSTSYDSPESAIQSLCVYNGKLYAGSGNSGIVYVYDGTTWSVSYDSPENYIFSMCVYNGKLYAGSGTSGIVYVFDGTTWSTSYDSPETYIQSMCVYNGKLYAGTYDLGIIYVFNGTTWSTSYDSPETYIQSMCVYNGKLYAGTYDLGIIYVFDGTTWSTSYDTPESAIQSLCVYNGKLYAGSGSHGIVYVFDGTTWSVSYDSPETSIYSMCVYNGKLYAGSATSGIVYVFGELRQAIPPDMLSSSSISLGLNPSLSGSSSGTNTGDNAANSTYSNVNNTSDANKPVSTAQQTEISKAHIDHQMNGFMGTPETKLVFDGTNLFTLTALSATWSYWRAGIKYTITGNKTATLPGSPVATGRYYIHIDGVDGTLTVGTVNVGWTLNDTKVTVAVIFFNNALTPKFIMLDERHTCFINQRDHMIEHYTRGTVYSGGGLLSGYTPATATDAGNTFGISAANIFDEDLYHTLSALTDGNGSGTPYRILYRTSTSAWAWKDSSVPLSYTTTGYIEYDTASGLVASADNRFVNYYLCFTNAFASNESTQGTSTDAFRFVLIPGRTAFTSATLAYASLFSSFDFSTATGFPFDELTAVWQITYDTSGISTTPKGRCVINRVARVSSNVITNSVSSSVSHEGLTGLQGGTTGEHLHATAAEYAVLQATSGTNTGDNAVNTHYSGLVTNATHTGDVTGSGTLTIGSGKVTMAMMANVPEHTLLYRSASGDGVPEMASLTTVFGAAGFTGHSSGNNTGDQLLTFIGHATTTNYFKIAEWTLTGAYGTFSAHISVMTTSKPALFEIFVLAALTNTGAAFYEPALKLKDVFGTLGNSSFWLMVDNATLKATLYFKDTTTYEPHYITRIDSILNATTVIYSNTDTGSGTGATGTYAFAASVN